MISSSVKQGLSLLLFDFLLLIGFGFGGLFDVVRFFFASGLLGRGHDGENVGLVDVVEEEGAKCRYKVLCRDAGEAIGGYRWIIPSRR